MFRSFSDRILGGVCGGLAQSTPINAWLWRILFVILTPLTLGATAFLYMLWWWWMPQDSPLGREGGGVLRNLVTLILPLLVIGGWLLRGNLSGPNGADLYGPAMAILMGVIFFLRQFGRSRTHPILGLLIIAFGVILLLNALDTLPAGIFDVLQRAWPALLIFLGLSIFLRERIQLGSIIALVISGALAGGIAAQAFNARVTQERTENQVEKAETIAENVSLLQVNVEVLATDVEILPISGAERAIRARFVGSTESEIVETFSDDGNGLATFTLRETRPNPFPMLEALGRGKLTLELPMNLALSMAFKGTEGDAVFNMNQLALERLDIDLFKGDALVALPAYAPLSPTVLQDPGNLTVREGNLTLRIPADVGGKFVLNRNMALRPDFDTTRYLLIDDGAGGTLQSANYDSFAIKLSYIITAPGGSIRLEVTQE